MRNAANKTPSGKQKPKDGQSADKSSGKKMVQARLPFKVIPTLPTALSPAVSGAAVESTDSGKTDTQTPKQDLRKRRLSYDGECETKIFSSNDSKENFAASKKKKTLVTDNDDIVLLDDSCDDDEPARNPKESDALSAIEACASPKTPLQDRDKGAGTPNSACVSGVKDGNEQSSGSSSNLQIKLPLSNKKKRKKVQRTSTDGGRNSPEASSESSDDIAMLAIELNPQKRLKVVDMNDKSEEEEQINKSENNDELNGEQSDDSSIEIAKCESKPLISEKDNFENKSNVNDVDNRSLIEDSDSVKDPCIKETSLHTQDVLNSKTDESKDKENVDRITNDADTKNTISKDDNNGGDGCSNADDDDGDDAILYVSTNILDSSATSAAEEIPDVETNTEEVGKSESSSDLKNINSIGSDKTHKQGLSLKQQRLLERRRKAREEKERKLQEEKVQKQRQKEEKELAKKREREEKELQRKKEREEKERKRLAEIEAKNEEKRKRTEVKEEELRKKEEERKRKEQEREEAENRKKKAADAFTKFFRSKTITKNRNEDQQHYSTTDSNTNNGNGPSNTTLAFRPFQVKGDMQLAPICRANLTDEARKKLDSLMMLDHPCENIFPTSQLYLTELKAEKIKPHKWIRSSNDREEEATDVIIIEDELEQAAQTIAEESRRAVERYRAKFYKFHENRRPPYFGTWRKRTKVIRPRQPFALDKNFFDYDVDSDLEWEEEEPGESLDGTDEEEEEKDKESEDDDYELDNEWFVPHGHLSEEELQNEEDGYGSGEGNTREAQKAKLMLLQLEFVQEMKKKTEKIKPRLIGCVWQDYNGQKPLLCPNIIWESLNMRSMLYTKAPLVEAESSSFVVENINEANFDHNASPSTANNGAAANEKQKRLILTDDMLRDLIRLVHGNRHSKAFLINEFIAYIEKTEDSIKNGDMRGPLKSVVRDKIDEFATWEVVEVNSSISDNGNNANNNRKRKKNKKKLCWLVSDEKLEKYNLKDLELRNRWIYTLQPKFVESHLNTATVMPAVIKDPNTADCRSDTLLSRPLSMKDANEETQQKKAEAENSSLAAVSGDNSITKTRQDNKAIIKKRVPLLLSVGRGEQISTPTKNALISQFLKRSKDDAAKKSTTTAVTRTTTTTTKSKTATVVNDVADDDDDVILLD